MAEKAYMDVLHQNMQMKRGLQLFNLKTSAMFSYLKPKQIQTIKCTMQSDCLSVLPTGFGKSLTYEVLPFMELSIHNQECFVVVLCPLNAIIQQELDKLGDLAFKAASTCTYGSYKDKERMLYMVGHPEDVLTPEHIDFISGLKKKVYVVVDEAHLVLDWGKQFRPMFQNISQLQCVGSISVLAITATASVISQKHITLQLCMKNPTILNSLPVLNSNVKLSIKKRPPTTGGNNRVEAAYDFIYKPLFMELSMNIDSFPLTIVYCKLKWCAYAFDVAKRILGEKMYNGYPLPQNSRVVQYHSPQPEYVNSHIIDDLKKNSKVKIILATIALGMGADLRNVRRIIHAGPPSSLEVYVQEVGRAGRDGEKAVAVLYYNNSDLCEKILDQCMRDYVRSGKCARQHLSEYFGSHFDVCTDCCDICNNEESVVCKKVPSLEQRHTLKQALKSYIDSDISGELDFLLPIEKIEKAVDCFEFILNSNDIHMFLDVPTTIAESIFDIVSIFQNETIKYFQ